MAQAPGKLLDVQFRKVLSPSSITRCWHPHDVPEAIRTHICMEFEEGLLKNGSYSYAASLS